MAEGIFIHLLKKQGKLELFDVDSAGTAGYHVGENPDHRMIETAKSYGVNLPSKARKFVPDDFKIFDIIIGMDQSNIQDMMIEKEANNAKAKVFKMRDFDTVEKGGDVPDPYFGGMNGFENVYQMLLRCNQNFLQFLENEN